MPPPPGAGGRAQCPAAGVKLTYTNRQPNSGRRVRAFRGRFPFLGGLPATNPACGGLGHAGAFSAPTCFPLRRGGHRLGSLRSAGRGNARALPLGNRRRARHGFLGTQNSPGLQRSGKRLSAPGRRGYIARDPREHASSDRALARSGRRGGGEATAPPNRRRLSGDVTLGRAARMGAHSD
jgi:hypothetical protein